MFIPHNTLKPVRISFTFSFLIFLVGCWTGLTIWAGYISGRHIDYWKIKADNEIMKVKVGFFAKEVKKSQEMLDQVKETDIQIRSLLDMKSKKDIIESDGKGGPTKLDKDYLSKYISGKIFELSQPEIYGQTSALQKETTNRLKSYKEVIDYVENQRSLFKSTPNYWPCLGHVTSQFGYRIHPIYDDNEFHSGLDIANEKNTPIYATAFGTVKLCDWLPGYGRLVILDNGHGYATYYGHMQKIMVKAGDHVKRGQLIGLMGDTGTSTGYHLHYEIQYNGKAINPVRFLKKQQL